jgi:hypothetical protein
MELSRMKSYLWTCAWTALVLNGCGAKTDVTPSAAGQPAPGAAQNSPGTQSFESPEATFQTARAAVARGDYQTFCDCWTDQGLGWLSGGMAMTINMFRLMSEKEAQNEDSPDEVARANQRAKQLAELLVKHGFTEGVVPELNIIAGEDAPKPVQQQVREQLDEISSVIPDQAAFFADSLDVIKEVSDQPMYTLLPNGSTLTELKIQGDSATGVILKPSEDQMRKCPATFSRVNGQWMFDEITGLEG